MHSVGIDGGRRPRLSVIVPVLNEAAHIGATLRDLVACRIPGTELLVVDGGSRDATPQIAERFCDRLIVAPEGRASQMNVGAGLARGEILWFVHADTRVPADAAALVDATVSSGRQWGRFDVRLSGKQLALRVIERMMNLRSCLTGMVTGDQGLFVTRALFRSVGGYPADSADGGYRPVATAGSPSTAGLPGGEADDVEPSLGARRYLAHGAADVAAARRLCPRGGSGETSGALSATRPAALTARAGAPHRPVCRGAVRRADRRQAALDRLAFVF
jgi:rSAM/selenodomain-associated transferase 2